MEFIREIYCNSLGLCNERIETPQLGLCTGCGNRVEFLKQTIKPNLKELDKHDNVTWTIVDYASEIPIFDDIVELLGIENLKSKKVRVFRYETTKGFNMSHSKNLSHRLSDKDFLLNLDCDVSMKKGCLSYLFSHIKNCNFFGHCNRIGLYGAVLLLKSIFYAVKGYDERFVRWAGEDRKLWKDIERLEPYITYMKSLLCNNYFHHIDHSDNLRFSWGSKDNYYDSNKEHTFGRGDVIDCFTGEKVHIK
jgi:hypothetical protein